MAMCARNQQALAANAERIRKQHNVEVFTEAFDVTDARAVERFVAAVAQKFGTVDICVTNAGGPPAKGFLAASLEDWQKAIDANFLSTVYFAREVIPHMQRQKWGRIITITSITTKQPVNDLVLSNAVRAGSRRSGEESGQRVRKRRNPGEQRRPGIHRDRSSQGTGESPSHSDG